MFLCEKISGSFCPPFYAYEETGVGVYIDYLIIGMLIGTKFSLETRLHYQYSHWCTGSRDLLQIQKIY